MFGEVLWLLIHTIFVVSMGFYLFGFDAHGFSRESSLKTRERSFWLWLVVFSAAYVAVAYLVFRVWHQYGLPDPLERLLLPGLIVASVWVLALALWIRMRIARKTERSEETRDA